MLHFHRQYGEKGRHHCLTHGLLGPSYVSPSTSCPYSPHLHGLSHVLLLLFLRQLPLRDWISWAILPFLPPLLKAGDSFPVPLPLGTHHLAAWVLAGGIDLKDGLQEDTMVTDYYPPTPSPNPSQLRFVWVLKPSLWEDTVGDAQLEGGPEKVDVLPEATQLGKARILRALGFELVVTSSSVTATWPPGWALLASVPEPHCTRLSMDTQEE